MDYVLPYLGKISQKCQSTSKNFLPSLLSFFPLFFFFFQLKSGLSLPKLQKFTHRMSFLRKKKGMTIGSFGLIVLHSWSFPFMMGITFHLVNHYLIHNAESFTQSITNLWKKEKGKNKRGIYLFAAINSIKIRKSGRLHNPIFIYTFHREMNSISKSTLSTACKRVY